MGYVNPGYLGSAVRASAPRAPSSGAFEHLATDSPAFLDATTFDPMKIVEASRK